MIRYDALLATSSCSFTNLFRFCVLQKAKKNLDAYWNGKTQLFGFFIGQVMKRCGGRVHPELANTIMQEVLEEHKQ